MDTAEDQPGFDALEKTLVYLVKCGFITSHINWPPKDLAVIMYDQIYGRGFKLVERPRDHLVYIKRLEESE